MPNSPSAKKSLRKSLKRRDENRPRRTALRNAVKKLRKLIEAHDEPAAKEAFQFAVKKLDQSAAKNIIHANTASRVKSRLAAAMKKAFAPEKVAAAKSAATT